MKILFLILLLITPITAQDYIVVLNDRVNKDRFVQENEIEEKGRVDVINAIFTNNIHRIKNNPKIKYIEENRLVTPNTVQYPVGNSLSMVDQRFIEFNETYEYTQTGRGVKAYVIDTGVYEHPDLAGRVKIGFKIGGKFNQLKCSGHGTMVAGIIGGTIHGVAKEVQIVSVRTSQCNGNSYLSDVLKGIDYVFRQNGTRVANISLGTSKNFALNEAVENLIASGVPTVVAAGNYGVDACTESPASAPNALTVSGADHSGRDTGFVGSVFGGYNYGTCVDLFAPSLGWTIWYDNQGNMYGDAQFGGTSFSTPYVTGAVALYLETHPNATAYEVNQHIIDNSTKDMLTIASIGSPNRFVYTR